jgi:hypothetical protein
MGSPEISPTMAILFGVIKPWRAMGLPAMEVFRLKRRDRMKIWNGIDIMSCI